MKVVWTDEALSRLEEIADFVGSDDPAAAARLVDKLVGGTEHLEEHTNLGRVVPEIANPAIREILEGAYRIVYRVSGDTIQVLTVFHGARLLRNEEIDE